jgi:hypothetical protein
LNRDLSGRFGDEAYAAEELVAELTAALAIPGKLRHAEYLGSWLKILRKTPGRYSVRRHERRRRRSSWRSSAAERRRRATAKRDSCSDLQTTHPERRDTTILDALPATSVGAGAGQLSSIKLDCRAFH